MPVSIFRFNHRIIFPVFCLLLLSLANLSASYIYVVNSESRTLSRIDTSTDLVQNAFAQLGLIPNKVIVDDDILWVVNSGDNAVQKLNRNNGSILANILVEAGCNPWDACLADGFLYVTGLFTSKVYKINPISNSVMGSVNVGICPEALCACNGKLYVANTGGYQNNYANSSVSVIDLAGFQVTETIPVQSNPQYIIEHNGLLHVSCTGNWIDSNGAVCVIDPASDEVIQTVSLGGSPGSIWVSPFQQALVGDANGLYLYRYDAQDYSIINGPANPLANGGTDVTGNNEFISLLQPNWGSNGTVRLLHPDLTFWKEYTVALAPTDIKLWQSSTAVDDNIAQHPIQAVVYPNPVYSGQDIAFQLEGIKHGKLSIYNIKGQIVITNSITSDNPVVPGSDFTAKQGSGFYFYKIETDKGYVKGKFILLN